MDKNMITKEDIDLNGIDVMFEITRFCNMQCPHCIRGESQKLRIKKDYINTVFSKLKYINTIMFTGGEPSLAIDLMKFALQSAKVFNVNISNFWMATNGTNLKQSFSDILEDWINYCDDNEITGLRISIDPYHDKINKWYWQEKEEEFKDYKGLNIYFEYDGAPKEERYLINDGRASDNYYPGKEVNHNIHLMDDGRIEGTLYVNAKGFIITTCDISYQTEDNNKEYTICHVNDDIEEGLANFFNKHPDLVYDEFYKEKELENEN